MSKYLVILAAVAMAGCAGTMPTSSATTGGFGNDNFSPGEQREKWNNPTLLNCPGNKPPVCENWTGSRLRKRLVNCRCRGFSGS